MTDHGDHENQITGIIDRLDHARAETRRVLDGIDPDLIVHPVTGWRVKDVIGHILVWEEEALRSLRALHQDDQPYAIPDFGSFDTYNQRDYDRRREEPFEQLVAALEQVREDIKVALRAVPARWFEVELRFPWPDMGTLEHMMLIMAYHERGHIIEIARAVEN
ncbi:MAG: DinB family protein [Anaerolineae bacterium]|nr:DinB family protein [Anaerolineae bacterium]